MPIRSRISSATCADRMSASPISTPWAPSAVRAVTSSRVATPERARSFTEEEEVSSAAQLQRGKGKGGGDRGQMRIVVLKIVVVRIVVLRINPVVWVGCG